MATQDLLIEIGTEELPPKALKSLALAFQNSLAEQLTNAELSFSEINYFATPRRLALIVRQLQDSQAEKTIERLGPNITAATDKAGNPSKAAIGFAKSCGVNFADLSEKETDKGTRLAYYLKQAGKSVHELLPAMTSNALNSLPIPKRMRWGSLRDAFVRPIHWLVMLYGQDTIPCELFGVTADRISYGHRFHHPQAITLEGIDSYQQQLADAHVLVDFQQRQETIKNQILAIFFRQTFFYVNPFHVFS